MCLYKRHLLIQMFFNTLQTKIYFGYRKFEVRLSFFFLFYLGEFSTALLTDFNLLWNINMNTKVYIVLLIRWCHLNLQIFIYFNLSPDSTSSFPLPSFPSPTAAAMIKLESQYVAPPNKQATIPSYDILGLYWTPDKYSQNVHQQTECCPKLKSNSDQTLIK